MVCANVSVNGLFLGDQHTLGRPANSWETSWFFRDQLVLLLPWDVPEWLRRLEQGYAEERLALKAMVLMASDRLIITCRSFWSSVACTRNSSSVSPSCRKRP